MITQYIKGDMVKFMVEWAERGTFRLFAAHGTNCFNKMGSGIAPQIAKAFPSVLERDTNYHSCFANDEDRLDNQLGTIIGSAINRRLIIVNAYTQYYPGPDLRMDALNKAFGMINDDMNYVMTNPKRPVLVIPKIGAGIAGGDWELIQSEINSATPDIDVIVFEWDPSAPVDLSLVTQRDQTSSTAIKLSINYQKLEDEYFATEVQH